jgi:hypothetical protein
MHADLDTLCTFVYCTADDLLPEEPPNARRRVSDAEIVTLCVAQAIMGIPSDRRFLAVARKRLHSLFPELPQQPGFHKRRAQLAAQIEWLIGVFAAQSPGFHDNVLLIGSTPVECGRSAETTRRSQLADAADYGWCGSHSRSFWGFRLHGLFAPDGTPRAFTLASPKRDEREVGIELLRRANRSGGEILIADKGYAGRDFAEALYGLGVTVLRPSRKEEPQSQVNLALIPQRIESIFWTCKDILTLERHGARTLHGLRVRIALRFLALAACISLTSAVWRQEASLHGTRHRTTHAPFGARVRPA